MTISVAVLANPYEEIPACNEGAYSWHRDYCEGDSLFPETLTICANCVILAFAEGEEFLIPFHRIQEIQWELEDTILYK